MTSDDKISNARSERALDAHELPQAQRIPELSLREARRKSANDQHGSDPYNTSGSFDRTKNWARIGKR
jgi:hypothetical protein